MKLMQAEKISNRQLVFLIIQICVGTGILSLPRALTKTTKQDAWLPLLIGGAIWLIQLRLLYQLANRFPKKNLFEYSPQILGSWLGLAVNISYLLYAVASIGIISRLFIDIVSSFLLPKTPILVTLLLLLIPCYYLSTKQVKVLARLDEFLFFILTPTFLILLPIIPRINWLNFQPVFNSGIKQIADGTVTTAFSFLGPEILLFLFPYLKQKQKSFSYAALGFGIVIATYLYLTVLTMGYYGAESLQYILWPAINILKALKIPFFGRIEFFFIFLWVAVGFTTIATYYFLANFEVRQLFNWQVRWLGGLLILPGVIYCFLLPQSVIKIFNYTTLIAAAGIVLVFIIPNLLLLTAKIRGIKGAADNE